MKSTAITELTMRAASDPVFRAVCQWFASRQRTRFEISARHLKARLEGENVANPRKTAESILRFLADLGLGTLELYPNGRLKGLGNIEYRLQSIGTVALRQSTELTAQVQKQKYQDINVVSAQESVHKVDFVGDEKKKSTVATKELPIREAKYPSFLTLIIEGKMVHIPGDLVTPDNIGEVISEFKHMYRRTKESDV